MHPAWWEHSRPARGHEDQSEDETALPLTFGEIRMRKPRFIPLSPSQAETLSER
jgi:hypothetical protein